MARTTVRGSRNLRGLRSLVCCALLAVSGCEIAGAWRVESVEPPQERSAFPLDCVTFEDEGTYRNDNTTPDATGPAVGQYSWNPAFYTLQITPKGSVTQFYKAYIRLDRKLILEREGKGPKLRAVLVRDAAAESSAGS